MSLPTCFWNCTVPSTWLSIYCQRGKGRIKCIWPSQCTEELKLQAPYLLDCKMFSWFPFWFIYQGEQYLKQIGRKLQKNKTMACTVLCCPYCYSPYIYSISALKHINSRMLSFLFSVKSNVDWNKLALWTHCHHHSYHPGTLQIKLDLEQR